MWHLFNMIPLLLCEFSLDDSELYECFLLLQEITTIVFSPLLCIEQIEYLEFLIPQYLEKFKEILQPRLLTPKFNSFAKTYEKVTYNIIAINCTINS